MNFLLVVLLFFLNFYLVIFFFLRALTVPSVLLVVSPTALARRFIRRSSSGERSIDIDVDARKLSDRMVQPKVLIGTAAVAIVGYAISSNFAYLWIAGAMLLTIFAEQDKAEQDKMDERTFEIWTRALAAVSDAVIVGVLFFMTIFRLQVDAFGLLTFMFFTRELLLFFARRWLESEPEFEPYDGGKSGRQQRIGVFMKNEKGNQHMVGMMLDEDPTLPSKASSEPESSVSSESESSVSSDISDATRVEIFGDDTKPEEAKTSEIPKL